MSGGKPFQGFQLEKKPVTPSLVIKKNGCFLGSWDVEEKNEVRATQKRGPPRKVSLQSQKKKEAPKGSRLRGGYGRQAPDAGKKLIFCGKAVAKPNTKNGAQRSERNRKQERGEEGKKQCRTGNTKKGGAFAWKGTGNPENVTKGGDRSEKRDHLTSGNRRPSLGRDLVCRKKKGRAAQKFSRQGGK